MDHAHQRITQLRKARKWSKAELSRRTGIHPSTLSHLEAGAIKCWPGHMRRIAQALGVSIDELRGKAA